MSRDTAIGIAIGGVNRLGTFPSVTRSREVWLMVIRLKDFPVINLAKHPLHLLLL